MSAIGELTHSAAQVASLHWLVERGARYAFDEAEYGDLRVDCVGLGRKGIIIVEVKVSRADYLKDFAPASTAAKIDARWKARVASAEAEYKAAEKAWLSHPLMIDFHSRNRDFVNMLAYGRRNDIPEFQAMIDAMGRRNKLIRSHTRAAKRGAKASKLLEMGIADQYYIAIPDGLVSIDEVPFGWGLIEARPWKYGTFDGTAVVLLRAPRHPVPNRPVVHHRWIARCASRCSWEVRRLRRRIRELEAAALAHHAVRREVAG